MRLVLARLVVWSDQLTSGPLSGHAPCVLEPVQRQNLSDAVFVQLRDRILDGTFEPGSALPGERDLASRLGTSRGAVREALRRLSQIRLVAIHGGGSTRVRDFRRDAGLDLLADLLTSTDAALLREAARSLIELRTALGPDIAARAAARGGPQVASDLEAVVARMELAPDDPLARDDLALELWGLIVDASANLAYRLAFNTMQHGWARVRAMVAPLLAAEQGDVAGHRALVRAVGSGDVTRAKRAAERLLAKGEAAMLSGLAAADTGTRRRTKR